MDFKKEKWEESYKRGENFIFYPHEECVRFINRFIKKKISAEDKFVDILKSEKRLKALDFGCGVGRTSILLNEFNIESYGIDISENAINEAKKFAKKTGCSDNIDFRAYDGENIPFENNFFDFSMSHAVLDSLSFELAKKLVKEIDRVTKKYFYLSLISNGSNSFFGTNTETTDEIIVEEAHEQGTIQCFYDFDKIKNLIENTSFKIKWAELLTHQDLLDPQKQHGRYTIVLEK